MLLRILELVSITQDRADEILVKFLYAYTLLHFNKIFSEELEKNEFGEIIASLKL